MERQNKLNDLAKELFENNLNQRISRREALSSLAKITGAAALSFFAGGLIGYLFAPKKEEIITETKTVTETDTKTEYKTETVTQTITSTKTITETYTTTKTEKPSIVINAEIGKGYAESASDVEIITRVYTDQKLDRISGKYWNASIKGKLNFKEFSNTYEAGFLTQREPGYQFITIEAEKDGAKAKKQLTISVGLTDEEIENSSIGREGVKILWEDLLKSKLSNNLEKLEEYLRKENELVNEIGLKQIDEPSSHYLKMFSSYLVDNKKDYAEIFRGLSLILPLIPSKPWIVYGNMVEDFKRAEFLINGEASYLLAKLLSEMNVEAKHIYAARAMIDQMLTIANWLKINPFEVLEYENKKLQLWDLTNQLFQKHLKFEANNKRASVADDILMERWSDRSKTNNNKHIYYGLRQVQLPAALLLVDAINRRYAEEDDEEFFSKQWKHTFAFPSPQSKKGLNILSKWIENYESLNFELNEILMNPNKKIKCKKIIFSPIERLHYYTWEKNKWVETYFPNIVKEGRKDNYETILFKGSREGKNPVILYGYSLLTFNSLKGLEEVRVELASCYGSLTGYPIYRDYFNYPKDKRPGWIHGEPSFILNKEDENILLKRSKDKLLIEEDTYTLDFMLTRLSAAKADKVEFRIIILPNLKSRKLYSE